MGVVVWKEGAKEEIERGGLVGLRANRGGGGKLGKFLFMVDKCCGKDGKVIEVRQVDGVADGNR